MQSPLPSDRVNSEDAGFIAAALEATAYSDDPRSVVGCVVVASDGRLVSAANSLPPGVVKHAGRLDQATKDAWIECAERAAIHKAAGLGIKLEGAVVYTTRFPCCGCARAIIGSGFRAVVAPDPELAHPRRGESFRVSAVMLSEAGVEMRLYGEAPARSRPFLRAEAA